MLSIWCPFVQIFFILFQSEESMGSDQFPNFQFCALAFHRSLPIREHLRAIPIDDLGWTDGWMFLCECHVFDIGGSIHH